MNANDVKISVIIPLVKERGAELECLRTWTHGQSLPRDQYQVILITRHDNAEVDRQAELLLQPHDLWLSSPGSVSRLYDLGARRAAAPLLFFTEVHCLGSPDCLEQLIDWAERHPQHAGACVRCRYRNASEIAEMVGRVFAEQFAAWSHPEHWHRVNLQGFAIRREVYAATDGFQPAYPDFTDVVLAAQLHRGGWFIDIADKAWVTHTNPFTWAQLREDATTYGASEHHFRMRADAMDYERYVAPNENWNDALAAASARPLFEGWALLAALAGLLNTPSGSGPDVGSIVSEAGSFARLIFDRFTDAILGPRWRLAELRLRQALAHVCFRFGQQIGYGRLQATREIWDLYIQEELVRQALKSCQKSAAPGLSTGAHEANRIPLNCWLGVYGLESAHGRPFRWTRPIFRLRWQLAPNQTHELILDTGGLRAHPGRHLFAAFWNGQRLASRRIREQGDQLHLTVRGAKTPENELLLVCMPFTPSRHGSSDMRMLGLPIFAMVCRELAESHPALAGQERRHFPACHTVKAA